MTSPRRTRVMDAREALARAAEGEQREERGPIVIEHSGRHADSLYERLCQLLDEAESRLVRGGVLYLTVPHWSDGEPVVRALRARFSRIGPLNVGSNPRLRNNDVRTRSGYLCVK